MNPYKIKVLIGGLIIGLSARLPYPFNYIQLAIGILYFVWSSYRMFTFKEEGKG